MADELLVYVGTYTRRGSEGVYAYRLNMEGGAMTPVGAGVGVENPSFLAVAPDKKHLYAVGEVGEF